MKWSIKEPKDVFVIYHSTDNEILNISTDESSLVDMCKDLQDKQLKSWGKGEEYRQITSFKILSLEEALEKIKDEIHDGYASWDNPSY